MTTAIEPEQQKPSLQEYWRGFPEAPFSDTFKWIDADGFEHMTTVRGWGDKSLSEGITKAKALIQYNGGKPAGKPAPAPAPEPVTVTMKDENGTPIVDADHNPIQEKVDGANVYTVKGLFHGKTQNGKDYIGVQTMEKPHDKKWGVKCFHSGGIISGWKDWPVGDDNPIVYAPPEKAKHVVIREAGGDSKYPEVVEFRA